MNPCKFAVAVLLISLAACTRAPRQMPSPVAPLTQEERLALRDDQVAINQAQKAAQNSKEAQVLQKAQADLVKTKEYAAFIKAQASLNDLPQTKAVNVATEAAKNAKETAAYNERQQALSATIDKIFSSRGISKDDYVICDGGGEGTIESCRDVKPGEIALRQLKKGN